MLQDNTIKPSGKWTGIIWKNGFWQYLSVRWRWRDAVNISRYPTCRKRMRQQKQRVWAEKPRRRRWKSSRRQSRQNRRRNGFGWRACTFPDIWQDQKAFRRFLTRSTRRRLTRWSSMWRTTTEELHFPWMMRLRSMRSAHRSGISGISERSWRI